MKTEESKIDELGQGLICNIEGVALWRTLLMWLEREFRFSDPTFYDLFNNYTAEIHSFLKMQGVEIEAESDPLTGYYELRALFPPIRIADRLKEIGKRQSTKKDFTKEFEDRKRRSLEEDDDLDE